MIIIVKITVPLVSWIVHSYPYVMIHTGLILVLQVDQQLTCHELKEKAPVKLEFFILTKM